MRLGSARAKTAASPSTRTATGRAPTRPAASRTTSPAIAARSTRVRDSLSCPLSRAAELEDVVDEIEQVLAGQENLLDLFPRGRRQRAIDLGHQNVREAKDRVERTAELVAHRGKERRAIPVGAEDALEVVLVVRAGRRQSVRQAR